jgi:hypothetical protein
VGPRCSLFESFVEQKISCLAVSKNTINIKRGAHGNRDSDQATGWIKQDCGSIPGRWKKFCNVQSVHKILGPTNSPFRRVSIDLSPDVKRVSREADLPSPSIAEVKNGRLFVRFLVCPVVWYTGTITHLTGILGVHRIT